jgi:hypothetical protein
MFEDPTGWNEPMGDDSSYRLFGFGLDQSDIDRPRRFEEQMNREPKLHLSIENMVLGVIVVFLLCVAVLVCTIATSTVDSTNYKIYSRTWDVNVVGAGTQDLWTNNPLLIDINISADFGVGFVPVAPADFTYSSDTSLVQVNNVALVGASAVRVDATSNVAEAPVISTLSVVGAGLVALAVFSVLGLVFARYKDLV